MLCSLPQLIHGTVVDTAIVFPHRLGLPYKRALRTLMADYLKRIIQDNGETSEGPHFLLDVVSSALPSSALPRPILLLLVFFPLHVCGSWECAGIRSFSHSSFQCDPCSEGRALPASLPVLGQRKWCGKAEGGSAKARSCPPFSLWPAEMDPCVGSGACSLLSSLSTLQTLLGKLLAVP